MSSSTTQNSQIHPTAVIHPTAKIDPTAKIGPYAIIGEEANIGPRVSVGPHAVVEFTDVGEGCTIFSGAYVGTAPQDLKYRGEKTRLSLGAGCVVRESVTLNRGTAATGITKIGARCLFMAYSHVAHDCVIGNEVILANSVAVAGHCEIGDWAIIGGLTGIHQFVRIGRLAMLGGGTMAPVDIPPFTLAWGNRARLSGLNLIGLRRRGFAPDVIKDIKTVYRELFDGSAPVKELIERLLQPDRSEPVQEFLRFVKDSPRGICRPSSQDDNLENA